MRLFGLAFLLTIVTLSASAQTPGLPQKIDEIENAGQLLSQGKVDEAFKQIQEAVKKYPVLPPARATAIYGAWTAIGSISRWWAPA
jgi:hypothetical protein